MKVKNLVKAGLALGLVGGIALAAAAPADAAKVRWKMQSTFGSSLPHLGTSATRFVDNVKVMSGGDVNIKFFELSYGFDSLLYCPRLIRIQAYFHVWSYYLPQCR